MKTLKLFFILALCALFFVVRIPELKNPWVNLLETGFQESIALHHLGGKILENHFMQVIAEIEGEKYFHTAHPPLLHLVYASLYSITGASADPEGYEWVTRTLSIILYLLTVVFWFRFFLGEDRSPFIFFPLALFFPLAFATSRTTNYEPLSLFFVTVTALAYTRYQEQRNMGRLAILIIALTLSMLTDWPAYLSVPALFILNIRKPREKRMLIALLAYQVLFLSALLFYQGVFTGEAAFFGHALTRSDPRALFSIQTYRMILSHLSGLAGFHVLILFAIFILSHINNLRKRVSGVAFGLNFFLVFAALLFILAPQLLARHYVHLLYFAPALIFFGYEAVRRSPQPTVLLIATLLLFTPTCYQHLHSSNYRYYHASRVLGSWPGIRTAFFSPAVGTLYYYKGVDTLHPVGSIAEEAFMKKTFDLVALETRNQEVSRLLEVLSGKSDQYKPALIYPDEIYYLNRNIQWPRPYLACGMDWPEVIREWWQARPKAVSLNGEPYYAIYQHPGPAGISSKKVHTTKGGDGIEFSVCVQHELPLPFSGDGVSFLIIERNDDSSGLKFFRYVRDDESAGGFSIRLNFPGRSIVYLITESGPEGDYRFDDAFWLGARWSGLKGD